MVPKYIDAWLITPITPTKRSSQASTSKLPINHNKRDRGLLTPPCTPTRSSRQTTSTASKPVTFNEYQTLQRSPVGDGDGGVVVFEKGDIVIISSSAKTKGQQWLKTMRDIKQKNNSATLVAKAKNRASHAVERVGIIKSFYEENRGEMRCRIHWLARPDLVWNGYDTKETWEQNELYFTTDSKYLEAQYSAPEWEGHRSSADISTSHLSVGFCHSVGEIDVKHILRHAAVTSIAPGPSQSPDSSTFYVQKLYDIRPLGRHRFIGPMEWDKVYQRGKETGEWDHQGFYEDETDSEDEIGDNEDDEDGDNAVALLGRKELAAQKAEIAKKKAIEARIRKASLLARKARLIRKTYGSDNESDSTDDGSEDDVEEDSDYQQKNPAARMHPAEEDDESDDNHFRRRSSAFCKRIQSKSTASPSNRTRNLSSSHRSLSKPSPRKRSNPSSPSKSSPAEKRRRKAIQPRLPAATFPTDELHLNANPFQLASARLHASATPEYLAGREEEQEEIRDKVGEAIRKARGELFFISGVPGTGKTATVYSALRSLSEDEDIDSFEFVEINGMKIPEPNQAFSLLWEALSGGSKVAPRLALSQLENHFATPQIGRKTTVVLVDELDQMVTKKQDVIYNFFNWPHMAHSKLIVIAIANTMDLPERELSGKIRSRLGSNRINFKTYSISQLEGILHARLEGLLGNVIEKDAVTFAAKKVGTVSGDARRALDICRRSIEKVNQLNIESKQIRKCGIHDVLATYKEMTDYGSNAFMKQLPLHSKIMLFALVQCIKKAGVPEVDFNTVLRWHLDFCRQISLHDVPSHDQLFTTLATLHTLRIVVTESQRLDYYQRVRTLAADSDIFAALETESILLRHLPNSASRRR